MATMQQRHTVPAGLRHDVAQEVEEAAAIASGRTVLGGLKAPPAADDTIVKPEEIGAGDVSMSVPCSICSSIVSRHDSHWMNSITDTK